MTPALRSALLLIVLFCTTATAETARKNPKKIRVRVEAETKDYLNAIASLPLKGSDPVAVLETSRGRKRPCVSQCERTAEGITVYWRVEGKLKRGESREYLIEPASTQILKAEAMNVETDSQGALILQQEGRNILQYNTRPPKLPQHIDPAYRRAGYLHPVWSPAGHVLTAINPEDHLHHYGIWNPWTSVVYDGKKYDLWNLGQKLGTVRLDTVSGTSVGDLFADLRAKHNHIIFRDGRAQKVDTPQWSIRITPKEEVVILHESLEIKAWNSSDDTFVWDFISDLEPATALPVLLKAYRYAGFTLRATADWTAETCEMLTSEGKTRPEIDGSHARWISIWGKCAKGTSGILIMSHPENRKHPEPLRVWDAKANRGRGDVMANFSPSKEENWTLEPGHTYRLRYRVVTYDGILTPEKAESLWQEFAHPVKVSIR